MVDEDWQQSKDSADTATGAGPEKMYDRAAVVREKAKSRIKTVTKLLPYV